MGVGEALCLSTLVRGAEGEVGRWGSDGSQLAVDSGTGVGLALASGRAGVTYTTPGSALTLQAELVVTDVQQVSRPLQ